VTDDAQEDRLRRHEAMLEGLAKIWEAHHASHERLDAWIERQDTFNDEVKTAINRIEVHISIVTELLQRQQQGGNPNGR
jgi:hypothetical protein